MIQAVHIVLDVVRHLDLRRGRDQGRIYRIAPEGFRLQPLPRLGSADTPTLVAALDSPNGWSRDTAHRLIFERQDRSAVGPLEVLRVQGSSPVGRILALWSLHGLDALTEASLANSLGDLSPRVVEQAVRLSALRLAASPDLLSRVAALADSADARVRFAVALALGRRKAPRRLMCSPPSPGATRLTAGRGWPCSPLPPGPPIGSSPCSPPTGPSPPGRRGSCSSSCLPGSWGAGPAPRSRSGPRCTCHRWARPCSRPRLVLALARGLKRSGGRLDAAGPPDSPRARLLAIQLRGADARARDDSVPEAVRLDAVALLGCVSLDPSRDPLTHLLGRARPVWFRPRHCAPSPPRTSRRWPASSSSATVSSPPALAPRC